MKESLMYVCPSCHKVFKVKSSKDKINCPKCEDSFLRDLKLSIEEWNSIASMEKKKIVCEAVKETEQINESKILGMTIQNALIMYKLPFEIESVLSEYGTISYKIAPRSTGATISRLQARLYDLSVAVGHSLEIISDPSGLYLRYKTESINYNYFDYNGNIDYDSFDIPYIVGFNNGKIVLDTLENACHIMVTGMNGSGKTTFLHNLIYSFICNPHDVLFAVDCKYYEFEIYRKYVYVATELFGENSVAQYTGFLVDKMEQRYKEMSKAGVKDFRGFKTVRPDEKRYILVIDEFLDIVWDKEAKKTILPRILKIAQGGRVAGFHLVLSTQQPNRTAINGTIKASIPTRLTFKTKNITDSRSVLGKGGAQYLEDSGEGLYNWNGAQSLERIKTPYITIEEIKKRLENNDNNY